MQRYTLLVFEIAPTEKEEQVMSDINEFVDED